MFCNNCGKEMSEMAETCPNCGHPNKFRVAAASPKSRTAALLLCIFLGIAGAHRFYVGKIGTGLAQLFTLGGLGVWTLVDLVFLACGKFKDVHGDVLA